MGSWRDRMNQWQGRTRFVVCRIFIHLAGAEVAPILGILNHAAQEAVDAEGDIEVLGKGLTDICQTLIQNQVYWRAAANEGDVFWREEEAGDYVEELFTDSAQRYLSAPLSEPPDSEESLSLPATHNLVVMVTVAATGETPKLETDLADWEALQEGLKTLITLHHQERLRAIQVHFSPARFGEELTEEQVLSNFPELIPL